MAAAAVDSWPFPSAMIVVAAAAVAAASYYCQRQLLAVVAAAVLPVVAVVEPLWEASLSSWEKLQPPEAEAEVVVVPRSRRPGGTIRPVC